MRKVVPHLWLLAGLLIAAPAPAETPYLQKHPPRPVAASVKTGARPIPPPQRKLRALPGARPGQAGASRNGAAGRVYADKRRHAAGSARNE